MYQFQEFLTSFNTAFVWVCGILLAVWWFKEVTMGIVWSNRRLDGKIVLITGANSGIGYETALDLAKRGAEIMMACRSMERVKLLKYYLESRWTLIGFLQI